MGYSMTPYAVDLKMITAVIGSKDESLLRLLSNKFEEEFDNIDALGDDYTDESEEEEEEKAENWRGINSVEEALLKMRDLLLSQSPPQAAAQSQKDANKESDIEESRPPCASTADALRHLIMGEECDRRVGFKYGYVLEYLCQHFGEVLPHDNWCDLRSCHRWFEELDDTLRLAGVRAETLSVNRHLIERGSPVSMPRIRGFPSIGYLRLTEIERALEALNRAKIDDIGEEEEEGQEPWLPEGLDDIRVWLRTCVESKRDLVCFYC